MKLRDFINIETEKRLVVRCPICKWKDSLGYEAESISEEDMRNFQHFLFNHVRTKHLAKAIKDIDITFDEEGSDVTESKNPEK